VKRLSTFVERSTASEFKGRLKRRPRLLRRSAADSRGDSPRRAAQGGAVGLMDGMVTGYGLLPKILSLMATPASSASKTAVVPARTTVCIAVRRTRRMQSTSERRSRAERGRTSSATPTACPRTGPACSAASASGTPVPPCPHADTCGSCCVTDPSAARSPGSKADPVTPSVGSHSVTPCRSLRFPRFQSQRAFEHGSLLSGNLPTARVSSQRKSTPVMH
jgi:hypothetical protein